MQTDILVFHHDAPGLQGTRDVEILCQIEGRRLQAMAQVGLVTIAGEADAIHRADVDAGVAFDAGAVGEHRLHITVQAASGLLDRRGDVKTKLDFDLDAGQGLFRLGPGHLVARVVRRIVVVAPLMDAHLLRDQIHHRVGTLADVFALQQAVDRDRGLVPVGHGGDDVLRSEGGITTEEDMREARLVAGCVDQRQAPWVETDAAVGLDPWKGVLLSDGDQHLVAIDRDVGLAGGYQRTLTPVVINGLDDFKRHSDKSAMLKQECLRDMEVDDRDALVLRVFLFPGRGLHLLEAAAHHHLDVAAAQASRRAAAVHRRVAAAEHDDALADLADMAKGDRGQPVDADVNLRRRLPASRQVQIASARRTAADEDGVEVL